MQMAHFMLNSESIGRSFSSIFMDIWSCMVVMGYTLITVWTKSRCLLHAIKFDFMGPSQSGVNAFPGECPIFHPCCWLLNPNGLRCGWLPSVASFDPTATLWYHILLRQETNRPLFETWLSEPCLWNCLPTLFWSRVK